ncbi:hypothetical protein EIP86_009040 [Pleurotus ostreatoroseus]|nr:hypothetical protein EIP86_009040 [Pleurotus ostreatoroseus]
MRIYYYEVEFFDKGTKGFSSGDVCLSHIPGWKKHSWRYHTDDGWSSFGVKEGIKCGPTLIRAKYEQVVATAVASGTAVEEQTQTPARKLVRSYLAHHGYARTARAFQAQCESLNASASSPAVHVKGEHIDVDASGLRASGLDVEYEHHLRARIDIINAVLCGDIDGAVAQMEKSAVITSQSWPPRWRAAARSRSRCRLRHVSSSSHISRTTDTPVRRERGRRSARASMPPHRRRPYTSRVNTLMWMHRDCARVAWTWSMNTTSAHGSTSSTRSCAATSTARLHRRRLTTSVSWIL